MLNCDASYLILPRGPSLPLSLPLRLRLSLNEIIIFHVVEPCYERLLIFSPSFIVQIKRAELSKLICFLSEWQQLILAELQVFLSANSLCWFHVSD